jgi:hypothetical protein
MEPERKTNGFGITALVLSIIGVVLTGIGLPLSILALIFSLIQRKRYPNGLNTAALIISIIGIALGLIIGIFYIAVLALYFKPSSTTFENPNTLRVSAPFYASSALITSNGVVSLNLINNGGEELTINSITVSNSQKKCLYDTQKPIAPGIETELKINKGPACSFTSGEIFMGDIMIKYTRPSTEAELISTGTIRSRVY